MHQNEFHLFFFVKALIIKLIVFTNLRMFLYCLLIYTVFFVFTVKQGIQSNHFPKSIWSKPELPKNAYNYKLLSAKQFPHAYSISTFRKSYVFSFSPCINITHFKSILKIVFNLCCEYKSLKKGDM